MNALPAVQSARMAEHLVNSDGDVLILIPPLPGDPVAFRINVLGPAINVGMIGMPSAVFGVPPQTAAAAKARRCVLAIEVGAEGPVRESCLWLVD